MRCCLKEKQNGGICMKDIVSVGEVLIDLTQKGVDAGGVPQYAANPGGAPANLAVAAARLGADVAFIGKVGRDSFGDYLRQVLADNRVDVSYMAVDPRQHTTLAVVSVDPSGERSFSFYREPSADVNLMPEEIPEAVLKDTRFLHFGSVSLTADPARSATIYAARTAKALGATVSYDPNYRANLWPNQALAVERMKEPLPLVDILKVSDEELPLLSGTEDLEEGTLRLKEYGIRLILVTLGAKGAYYRLGNETGTVPGVRCQVADTNGAGDTFFGAVLGQLSRQGGLKGLTADRLEAIVALANKAASLTTSRPGAIPAMPTARELGIE